MANPRTTWHLSLRQPEMLDARLLRRVVGMGPWRDGLPVE